MKVCAWPLQSPRTLVALIGPAGVGKTTTAAKLAARARLAKKSVTLVGCDTFRVGAVEQLSRYAELMDVEFVTARTADELQRIIEAARTDVVIVDTAGRNPTPDGVEIALAPPAAGARVQPRARQVCSAPPRRIRSSDAARLAKRYGNLGPRGSSSPSSTRPTIPAGLVHAGWAAKLSIAVLCNGPRVPEDIAPATLPP